MILLDRIRKHRTTARHARAIDRETRAIDRAVRTAPTRSAREEILFFAQRHDF